MTSDTPARAVADAGGRCSSEFSVPVVVREAPMASERDAPLDDT